MEESNEKLNADRRKRFVYLQLQHLQSKKRTCGDKSSASVERLEVLHYLGFYFSRMLSKINWKTIQYTCTQLYIKGPTPHCVTLNIPYPHLPSPHLLEPNASICALHYSSKSSPKIFNLRDTILITPLWKIQHITLVPKLNRNKTIITKI